MTEIKKYHLHKDDYSKLHFQINDAAPYCQKNIEHCYKPHQHSFYQLIWFKEEGQHYVDYEVMTHKANTLFFLNKKQVHAFCNDSSNEGILFHFDELFLNKQDTGADNWLQYKLFNEIGLPHVALPAREQEDFNYLTSLLKKEINDKKYNYRKQAFHLFQSILLKIERLKRQQAEVVEEVDKAFVLAIDFKRLIDKNIGAFLSVEAYGRLLNVNTKKLTVVSKRYLKATPLRVIHQRKILEAKRLLSNADISIKGVAYALGFEQPTYFTKYFKKHTGVTPKGFLKQLR